MTVTAMSIIEWPATAGEGFWVDSSIENTGLSIPNGMLSAPFMTLTYDGVVVAQRRRDGAWSPYALANWSVGDRVHHSDPVNASGCDQGVSAADLPSGTYQLWLATSVATGLDGTGPRTWFYGGPWDVTLTHGTPR